MRFARNYLVVILALILVWAPFAPAAAQGHSYADTIEDLLEILRRHYLRPIDAETEQRMLEEALKGLLRGLDDPYTTYMTPQEYQQFVQGLEGEQRFGGVGIRIEKIGDYITVVSPLRGAPAEAAGVLPRDRILKADGIDLVGQPLEKATYLIRGEPGSPVTLTIAREGVPGHLEITIIREEIVIQSVESELKGEVGYIILANFPLDSASRVRQAVESLEAQGATSILLDLRGNGGGYLNAAISTAELFLPLGTGIVDVFDREGLASSYVSRQPPVTQLPMAVLVDTGSASAAEILAAALRESGRARLVGSTTFGKGTVQSLMYMADGGVLKVTTSEFRTPRGWEIESMGVRPHLEVEGREAQLRRALMYLEGRQVQSVRFPTDRSYVVMEARRIEFGHPVLLSQMGSFFHLETVAELFGLELEGREGGYQVSADGVRVMMIPGQDAMTVDGSERHRPRGTMIHEGDLYISLGLLQEFLGFVGEHDRVGRWIDLKR